NPGSGEGGTGNGTLSTPGWDFINGKYTPVNGIYPGFPYGPANGDYNGMPFPAGAGALGIFSPYSPGYNGINNLSNLNKFASSDVSKAQLRERDTIWDEIEDGASILESSPYLCVNSLFRLKFLTLILFDGKGPFPIK